MKPSMLERCEAQIRSETALRKVSKLDYEAVMKLCAMIHVNAGREVDVERMKDCNRILKENAGIFSNFRGTLQRVVVAKMAVADDPAAYIRDVMDTYQQLKTGIKLPGEMIAMAATTIVENCPANQRAEVVRKTLEAYTKLRKIHPFLTDENDVSLIALMIMAGKDPDRAVEEAEALYQAMKQDYKISSDVAQSAAMVLALSDKPVNQKLESFFALFDACKAAKHATSRDKAMVVYSAFADTDCNPAEIAAAIGEVDDWLKGQKGYGAFSLGSSERRLFAASMVLEDLQASRSAAVSLQAGHGHSPFSV